MALITKEQWQQQLYEEFKKAEWNGSGGIIELMLECLAIAKSDVNKEFPYTDVVIDNLKIISNKKPMNITFKQWKCLRAYAANGLSNKSIEKLLKTNSK